jgi:hypothetical protein
MNQLFIKILIAFLLCMIVIHGQLFALENGDIMIVRDREKVDYYNHLFAAITSENYRYARDYHGQVRYSNMGSFEVDKNGYLKYKEKDGNNNLKYYAYIEKYYNNPTDFSIYLVAYYDDGESSGVIFNISVSTSAEYGSPQIGIGRSSIFEIGIDDVCAMIYDDTSSYYAGNRDYIFSSPFYRNNIFSNVSIIGMRGFSVKFLEKFTKKYEKMREKKDIPEGLEGKSNIVIVSMSNSEKMERYTKLFVNFINEYRIGYDDKGNKIPVERYNNDALQFYTFLEESYINDKNFSIYLIMYYSYIKQYRYYHLFADEQNKQFYIEMQGYNRLGIDGLFYQIEMDELSKEFVESPFRTRKYIDIKELYKYNERQK